MPVQADSADASLGAGVDGHLPLHRDPVDLTVLTSGVAGTVGSEVETLGMVEVAAQRANLCRSA
jgi:hypothetical protein